MKRWMRWTLPLLVVLILAGVAARTIQARRQAAAAAPAAASAPAQAVLELAAADVLTLGPLELVRTLEVSGSLRAVNSAFVKARVAGELQSVAVREGDTVKAGQVLAQLDTTESDWKLRQAEQQAVAAKAQLEIAQRALTNNKALVAQGFISTTALETAISTEAGAQATLQAALAAVELARKARADTTLVAPIAGLVAQRLAQPGERVPVDAKVLEIVDLRQLELEAAIAPQDVPALRVGATARLVVDGDSQALPARVVRINPSAQAGSRTVPAYLAVDNQPSLRNGLFMRGTIELARQRALALPLTAVRTDQAKPYAIRMADGRAEQRTLRLGARGEAGGVPVVEVLDGLSAGDRVLAATAGLVPSGTLLRVAATPATGASPAAAAATGAGPAAATAIGASPAASAPTASAASAAAAR